MSTIRIFKKLNKVQILKVFLSVFGVATLLVVLKLIFSTFDRSFDLVISQMLLLTNILCTFFMLGLIWVIQIVNYPLFKNVGEESFVKYHQEHVWRITSVVFIPMFLEGMTAVMLLWYPHPSVPAELILFGLTLIFLVWLSTLFLLVPQHDGLLKGFNNKSYRNINAFNWIRTIAWSLRAVICVLMLLSVLNN
jgi:hypothetical protein